MNDALMYFLKVNIAIALFYLFYRLVFYNDTFWATRRLYLAVSILLSLAYPFISLSGWLEKQEPMQVILSNYVQLNEITVTPAHVSYLTLENILLAAYAVVSVVLLVRMVVQLGSVLRWRLKGKRQTLNGVHIIAIDAEITPFSFFNSIFINPDLHNDLETKQILAHENTHARQLHSLDVLLSELLTITCWINPAAWLLKREIRHNLEFLADNSVLQSGFDSKKYQYHLLQLSYQVPENHLINKFNVSPLKKRITMMNQQKSKKAGILKYSLIVPLALVLVLSSNAETIVSKTTEVISKNTETAVTNKTANTLSHDCIDSIEYSQTKVVTPKLKAKTLEPDSIEYFTAPSLKAKTLEHNRVYNSVDKMPEYPGGTDALMKYIAQNLKYPIKAQENNTQGKVVVRFIINKYGKVEQAETGSTVVRHIIIKHGKVEKTEIVQPDDIKQINSLKEIHVFAYDRQGKAETDKVENKTNLSLSLLEKEALRVVNSLPAWTPGERKGKKVAVYYTLPITFKLE